MTPQDVVQGNTSANYQQQVDRQTKVKTQLQEIVQKLRSNIKDLIDAGAEHDVIDAVNNAAATVDYKEKTMLLGSAFKSLGAHAASIGSFQYGRTGIENSDK